jgi:hypothetical protein
MEGAGKATMSISCFEQRVFFEKVTEVKLFATKAPRGTIFLVRGVLPERRRQSRRQRWRQRLDWDRETVRQRDRGRDGDGDRD